MHFRFGIISENLKHPWKIWSMDNYSSSCLQNGNTDSNSVHPASLSISQKEQQVRVKVRHPVLPHGTSQQVRYLAVRILKKPPPPHPSHYSPGREDSPTEQACSGLPPHWLPGSAASPHHEPSCTQAFAEVLLCAQHCSRHWVNETDTLPALWELTTSWEKKLMLLPCR